MKTIRNALLGACLALPLFAATGQAQTTIRENGHTITVPPGAMVLIVPGVGMVNGMPGVATKLPHAANVPQNAPMFKLIAQQQAMLQQVMAQMNAMMGPMPDPSQLLRAAFGAGGPMLTLAGGPGVCSESISIVQHGNSAPVVTRSQSGCGAATMGHPANVRELPAAPAAAPGPTLLRVSNPPARVPNPAGTPMWVAER